MRTLILVLAAAAACAHGGAAETTPDPRWAELAADLDARAAANEFSGVVRIDAGGDAFVHAVGLASRELGVPNEAATRFKIHSSTKTLTAVAVMRAAMEGRLSIDDPVCARLDPCPDAWDGVRLTHLMNHTSGIPDQSGVLLNEWEGSVAATYEARFDDIAARPLATEPGAEFRYSNFGPTLLGLVLEQAYGADLETVFDRLIFAPLGMDDTGLDQAPPQDGYDGPVVADGLASGYNGSPEQPITSYSKMYVIPGAGGAISTAADLATFMRAAFGAGDFLRADLRAAMTTPRIITAGYGVFVDAGPPARVRHDGGNNGYLSMLVYYPDAEASLVVLSNVGFADLRAIRADAEAALFGASD